MRQRSTALYTLSFILTDKEYSKLRKWLSQKSLTLDKYLLDPERFSQEIQLRSKDHRHATAINAATCSHKECLPATIRVSTRSFAAGYALVTLVDIIPAIWKRQNLLTILKKVLKKDSARFAFFVGIYTALYRTLIRSLPIVTENLKAKDESKRRNRLRNRLLSNRLFVPFVAGTLAGATQIFDQPGPRRISVSLYALTKTSQFLYQAAESNGYLPTMPWWWGSWIIFSLSSAQLISAFLMHPEIFPRGYGDFITSRSTTYLQPRPKDVPPHITWPSKEVIVENIRNVANLQYPKYQSPLIYPDSAKLSQGIKGVENLLTFAHPKQSRLMCALLHPQEPSCLKAFLNHILKELPQAIRFMALIYAVAALLKWKRLKKDPNKVIAQVAVNAISAGFSIIMAFGSAWALICLFQRLLPGKLMKTSRFFLNGFIGGSWIVLDRNRSTDIALYSARFSLLTYWNVLLKQGKVKSIANGEVLYFSLSMGILMTLYEFQKDSINSSFIKRLISVVLGR